MPGRPHDVRAKNASLVTRTFNLRAGGPIRHAQPERPLCGLVLLRLHRTEPRHHILRPAKTSRCNVLISQPTLRDCHRNPHDLPPPISDAPIEGELCRATHSPGIAAHTLDRSCRPASRAAGATDAATADGCFGPVHPALSPFRRRGE